MLESLTTEDTVLLLVDPFGFDNEGGDDGDCATEEEFICEIRFSMFTTEKKNKSEDESSGWWRYLWISWMFVQLKVENVENLLMVLMLVTIVDVGAVGGSAALSFVKEREGDGLNRSR